MSKRNSDRVKIVISWDHLANNPLMEEQNKAIKSDIRQVLCSLEHEAYLARRAITHLAFDGQRYEFRIWARHKAVLNHHRTTDWESLFWATLALKEQVRTMAPEFNAKIDIDMGANRMPWVFNNADEMKIVTEFYARPGAAVHQIVFDGKNRLLKPADEKLHKALGFMGDEPDISFNEVYLVGEPGAVKDLAKIINNTDEGQYVSPMTMQWFMDDRFTVDNCLILTRDSAVSRKWFVYGHRGHCKVKFTRYTHALLTGQVAPAADLGLRYTQSVLN